MPPPPTPAWHFCHFRPHAPHPPSPHFLSLFLIQKYLQQVLQFQWFMKFFNLSAWLLICCDFIFVNFSLLPICLWWACTNLFLDQYFSCLWRAWFFGPVFWDQCIGCLYSCDFLYIYITPNDAPWEDTLLFVIVELCSSLWGGKDFYRHEVEKIFEILQYSAHKNSNL